ncbi:MAG TPA: hypothetical protein VFQ53_27750 [Kofleriaceae bacterium]|nr:hypothetical protein [Kofleriaceae bacterium]
MMTRWMFVILVACSSRSRVAAPVASDAPKAAPAIPDVPEPAPPPNDCAFARSSFCVRETGPSCAPSQPRRNTFTLYELDAQLSPGETRAQRSRDPDLCCYVEFTTTMCD